MFLNSQTIKTFFEDFNALQQISSLQRALRFTFVFHNFAQRGFLLLQYFWDRNFFYPKRSQQDFFLFSQQSQKFSVVRWSPQITKFVPNEVFLLCKNCNKLVFSFSDLILVIPHSHFKVLLLFSRFFFHCLSHLFQFVFKFLHLSPQDFKFCLTRRFCCWTRFSIFF